MLPRSVRPVFRAVATTVVPEADRLSDDEWLAVEAIVERALADRGPRVRRQLLLFVRLLNMIPLATSGRTFVSLDRARRTVLLERLARSRTLLVRRGVWGVRTLAFMGYYARPAVGSEIGYRASPRGWRARDLAESP